MEVSKKQITDGLIRFIDGVLMPQCKDKQTSLILSMSKDMLKKKGDLIDSFLDNSLISSVIIEDDGMYEISHFIDSMKNVLTENNYPITLPTIPLLAPDSTTLHLTANNFDQLVNYIVPQSDDD